MADDRHFWVLDPRVIKYVRFGEFHWWELLTIAAVLTAFASYAVLAVVLDRRERRLARRRKHMERLDRWLTSWELEPGEQEALEELAGGPQPQRLYELLADPIRFERTVHAAQAGGEALGFTNRIREALGYTSESLGVPVVSTRQLCVGDHFRLTVWEEGRPQHHYGVVTAVSAAGVTLELTEQGFKAVTGTRGEVELFFLRGNDLEVRFPLVIRSADAPRFRLLLSHQLVRGGQRARAIRLPMKRPITFRTQQHLAPRVGDDDVLSPDPAAAVPRPGRQQRGALLEMSEGGFSMVTEEAVAEGAYVEFELPMPRGRLLPIVGRVMDCRAFAGKLWLVRCELRGLLPTQRNTLSQLLRLEQAQRLRAMQEERRKRQRSQDESA